MLFERRLREGISAGTITIAFRRWRRSQVVAGGRYRTGIDIVEVESVDVVADDDIAMDDANAAGYASVQQLRADLRGPADLPIYRIRFRRTDEADPREQLAADGHIDLADVAALDRSLSHMDTRRATFKRDVRRLKELGLTVSLPTGYRLSARGESYLRHGARGIASLSPQSQGDRRRERE